MALPWLSVGFRLGSSGIELQFVNNPRGLIRVPKMGEDFWAGFFKKVGSWVSSFSF